MTRLLDAILTLGFLKVAATVADLIIPPPADLEALLERDRAALELIDFKLWDLEVTS